MIDRFLRARIAEGRVPGARWIVWHEGEVVADGTLGLAAVEPEPRALEPATPFDLASLTKPLATAPLLLQLVEEGRLDLDAPIGDRIPLGAFSDATLRMLATHTSGLPAWRPLYREARGIDGYLAAIAALEPAVPRGEVLYSDLGYIVLGALCERVTGESLAHLFDKRLAAPHGVKIAFAGSSDAAATERSDAFERRLAGARDELRPRIAVGEVHDGNAFFLGGAAGHAGLFGAAAEVARLTRALCARRQPAYLVPDRSGRSVGWDGASRSRSVRGILPDGWIGHLGFTGGSLWLDPGADSGMLLLTHCVHPVVSERDFVYLRRGFHRLAAAASRRRS